jgi:hypothetical protein
METSRQSQKPELKGFALIAMLECWNIEYIKLPITISRVLEFRVQRFRDSKRDLIDGVRCQKFRDSGIKILNPEP